MPQPVAFILNSPTVTFPTHPPVLHPLRRPLKTSTSTTTPRRRRLIIIANDVQPPEPTPKENPEASEADLQELAPDEESDHPETDDGAAPPSDGSQGNGVSGGGSGDGGEDDYDGESESDNSIVSTLNDVAKETSSLPGSGVAKTTFGAFIDAAGAIRARVLLWFDVILKAVPAPVLVALISLVSTITGAKYNNKREKQKAIREDAAAAKRRKDQIEQQLRKRYMELAAPILKSAAKMAERIYALVDGDWDSVEKDEIHANISPTYSAYLLGRYLAMVEIIKKENALLDYGFPAADRILANILGRIQGVLSAGDDALMEMQRKEHLFQPGPDQKILRAGPLRVTARAQTVLGELLLRKLWMDRYDFVDKVDAEELKRGPKAVLSFLEFSRLYDEDFTVAKWYRPVVKDFSKLEMQVQSTDRNKRRTDSVGSRVYVLQNGLLDLVEFFDPLPDTRSVPLYRRRRLQLGKRKYGEEQRTPLSLRLLYRELANVRDLRILSGNQQDRLRLPGGAVELHVKAAPTEYESVVHFSKPGDCPYSQRVMIVLEELGIPYSTVYHAARSKPGWYYLLHPENETPVVYHDGNLIEDSSHIISYLLKRFTTGEQLGSASNLRLSVGTSALTRFHDAFLRWIESGKGKGVLEGELRTLNRVIGRAQKHNEGAPFLGGSRFSREDMAIAPMLNNMEVAGKAVMKWEIPEDFQALKIYLLAARKVESFQKSVASNEAIAEGYRQHQKEGRVQKVQFADMLE